MSEKILTPKQQIRLQISEMPVVAPGVVADGWFRWGKHIAALIQDGRLYRGVSVSTGRRRIVLREYMDGVPYEQWSKIGIGAVIEMYSTTSTTTKTLVPIGSPAQVVFDFINTK